MSQLDVLTDGFTFTSDQGLFGWSTITLMTLGSRRILVDTGSLSRRGLLVKAIECKGLACEDIDTVVLTHLHWDHCQNTDLFSNARILVNPTELDYARNPARGDTSAAWYVADMMAKMKAEPISEGDEVAEGVSVIETPSATWRCCWRSMARRSWWQETHCRMGVRCVAACPSTCSGT